MEKGRSTTLLDGILSCLGFWNGGSASNFSVWGLNGPPMVDQTFSMHHQYLSLFFVYI